MGSNSELYCGTLCCRVIHRFFHRDNERRPRFHLYSKTVEYNPILVYMKTAHGQFTRYDDTADFKYAYFNKLSNH